MTSDLFAALGLTRVDCIGGPTHRERDGRCERCGIALVADDDPDSDSPEYTVDVIDGGRA